MRQHVLQVGKSQDKYRGIMGMRRILSEPTGAEGWCVTLSEMEGGACAAGCFFDGWGEVKQVRWVVRRSLDAASGRKHHRM